MHKPVKELGVLLAMPMYAEDMDALDVQKPGTVALSNEERLQELQLEKELMDAESAVSDGRVIEAEMAERKAAKEVLKKRLDDEDLEDAEREYLRSKLELV